MADSYDVIDVRREDCIDYVTLNRSAVRNAIDDHLIEELTRWAEGATHDSTLRMAVLGAAGPSFCSGADLGWRSRTVDLDAAVARVVRDLKAAGPRALAASKTLIAAVMDRPPATVTQLTVETIADLRISAEAKEGIRAFLDKRSPAWVEGDCP